MTACARAWLTLATSLTVVGSAGELGAQTGVVRGRVLHSDGAGPIADAQVVLSPSGASTRSGVDGRFVIGRVEPGQVRLTARRPGFVAATLAVRVSPLDTAEVQLRLRPAATALEPIVTSATRDPRRLSDVGWAVSVADSAAIARAGTIGLHEALRAMPGVQATSRWGTEDVDIGIRGSAARAAATPGVRGVAVLLDGISLTEPDGLARLDMIELADVRQVEVVRGPASVMYAGASGGVVDLVSKSGRDSRGVTLRTEVGSFGLRKYAGRAGGVLADGRASGLAAVSSTSMGGYRAHSEASAVRAHGAADYEWTDAHAAVEVTGSRIDSRFPGSLDQAESDLDPRSAAPVATLFGVGRRDRRYRAGVRMDRRLGGGAVDGNVFVGERTLSLPSPAGVLDLDLHRRQGGVRLRSPTLARLALRVVAGVDYDEQHGPERIWENDAGSRGMQLLDDGRLAERLIAGYGQVEWAAASDVSVTAGARYDRLTYRFASETPGAVPRQQQSFDQLSPRVGVSWRPDSVTSTYASIGRGVEFPVIGEISDYAGAPLGKARPKSLWNYELGARRRIGERLRVEAAAFVSRVRGEFVPITIDGIDLVENASRSRNRGVELGLAAVVSRRLEVESSYALLDMRLQDYATARVDSTGASNTVDLSGRRMPAVPRQRFTLGAQVRPLSELELHVAVEWQDVVFVETSDAREGVWYVQPQPGAPVQRVPFRALPAHMVTHVDAAYRFGAATIFGGVQNVTNQRYAGTVAANDTFGRFYFPASPRSASLGMSVTAPRPTVR
jgi:iron complex outermembrane receptor protein